tara:strand:- start:3734 stop:3967 length:234 start_codon:yes stop_codon:yes gene_type:complete
MQIEVRFKATLDLLASVLMVADVNNKLPENISKAWIRDEFTSMFYVNGIGVLESKYYKVKYFRLAEELNEKYSLDLH